MHVNIFLRTALLYARAALQGSLVRQSERWLHEAPRPQVALADHVDLGRVEGDLSSQIDPDEQPDDEGKSAVGRLRMGHLMRYVVVAGQLDSCPNDGPDCGTGEHITPGQVLSGEDAEAHQEEP